MIRLGVIGYGKRAATFINNALRPEAATSSGLCVAALVTRNEVEARAALPPEDRQARFYDDVDTMMREAALDAVFVGTRCDLHATYAIKLLEYDIPVFLEKPVAISMEQALQLEQASEHTRCPVVVSFPLRLSPLCRVVRNLIIEGAVGRPVHILTSNYVPYGTVYWERFFRDYQISGGLFLQKASHEFDYMMHLMGAPVVTVSATCLHAGIFGGDKPADLHCAVCDERRECPESPQNRRRNGSGGSLEDHPCLFSSAIGTPSTGANEQASSALLEFASGAQGVFTQVFFSRRNAARRGSIISGYDGTLDFDWTRNDVRHVRHHDPFTSTTMGGEAQSHFGGDAELARNFIAVIEHREATASDLHSGLRSVYTCLAAREAARTATVQAVRQIGQL
jgi:predicted dehydrogenase